MNAPRPPHPEGGRPFIGDRAVLGGIVYMLRAGVPWRLLPAKAARRGQPDHVLAPVAGLAGRRGLGRVAPPAAGLALVTRHRSTGHGRGSTRSACAPDGGAAHRPQPCRPRQAWQQVPHPDRRAKHPARDRIECRQPPRLPHVGAGRGRGPRGHRPSRPAGRPHKRPAKLHADRGYDYPRCRRALRRRNITPTLPAR